MVSLMGGSIVHSLGTEFFSSSTSPNGDNAGNGTLGISEQGTPLDVPLALRVQITMAVTLAVGVWQVKFLWLLCGNC